jgi:hypothetical protein
MSGSLNKLGGGRENEKSKILRINLPLSNPNIKTAIDDELDNGWHIVSSTYIGESANQIIYVLTKPKRN